MDFDNLREIDTRLAEIRAEGDIQLAPCPLVTDRFVSAPPFRVGVSHLVLKPRFLLRDPTGCGKTAQAMVAYGYLRQSVPTMRMIVAVKRAVQLQWATEVYKFLDGVEPIVAGWELLDREGNARELSPGARHAQYEAFLRPGGPAILIGTHVNLAKDLTGPSGTPNGHRRRIWTLDPAQLQPYVLVIDEAHKIKDRAGTLMNPAYRLMADYSRYCWGLTATPIMNRLEELYAVMELIRPGTFGPFNTFANTYLKRKLVRLRNGRKIWMSFGPKLGAEPIVAKIVEPYALGRPAEVFSLYLPKVSIESQLVDLSEVQRRFYRQILLRYWPKPSKRQIGGETPDGTLDRQDHVTSRTAARISGLDPNAPQTKLTALLYAQLAVDAPTVMGYSRIPNAKLDALVESVTGEFSTDRVLIYTKFVQVANVIADTLRKQQVNVDLITGAVSAGGIQKVAAAFRDPSSPTRILCFTSAGGDSLNLQAARVVIFYDLPWSWGELTQVIGRAKRTGSQHQSVLVRLLGASQTIDQHALAVLQQKEKLVSATFESVDVLLRHVDFDADRTSATVYAHTTEAIATDLSAVNALFRLSGPTGKDEGESLADPPTGHDDETLNESGNLDFRLPTTDPAEIWAQIHRERNHS